MGELLTLHNRLVKIEKNPDYDSLYNAVHASKNPFVINYFDSCVDALAFNGAVIVSLDLALDKIKDQISYFTHTHDSNEVDHLRARRKRILNDASNNNSIWCVYDPKAKLESKFTAITATFLDIRVVEPLANITGYKPKNIATALNYYRGDITITKENDTVFDNVSVSDELDNNDDSTGGHAMNAYNRQLDHQAIKNLEAKRFNSVADPKEIEAHLG